MTPTLHRLSFLSAAVLLLGPGVSTGAEIKKADNTAMLNTLTSWVGGTVPGASDVAVWDNTLTANRNNSLGGNLSWAGIKVTNPGGTLYTIANTASSTLTLGASGIDMSAATADLTIAAILNINANQTWTVAGGRTLTLTSSSNGGTGDLTLAGSGTFSVNNAGTIFGTGALNLNNGVNLTGNTSRTISNAVNLNGNIGVSMTASNLLTFAGGMDIGAGTRTITVSNPNGSFTTPTLGFTGNGTAGVRQITGSGVLNFENGNAGSSPVVAIRMGAGATDYPLVRADVSIGNNVEMYFQVPQVFTADSDLTVKSGGVFNMSNNGGSSASQTIGSLAGSGTVLNARTSVNNTAILTIDGGASTATTNFSGNIITGTGNSSIGIVKEGASTQIFSGSNNYYGQTMVNAGSLLISGTHADSSTTGVPTSLTGYSGTAAGHYQVASGAELGGSGLIAGNNSGAVNTNMILVQSGGILAPGGDLTTLRLDGASISGAGARVLNMAAGANFSFTLAGDGTDADQLAFWNYAGGDLLLNSNQIDLTLTGPLVAGTYTVTLFSFYSDSGTTLTDGGIVSGLSIGILGGGIVGTPTLNYNAGGNTIDLTYTVVPEPGVWALLGPGLGLLLWRTRRRAPLC